MALETTLFDPAEYLTDKESIAGYLSDALENDDARGIISALNDVVRARGGFEPLSRETGLTATFLAEALGGSGMPDFAVIMKIMNALGVRLSASLVA